MSFYINFRKEDEPKIHGLLSESYPPEDYENLRDVFETDYHFDEADSSINAVSDYFVPDVEEFLDALASANLAAYGVIVNDSRERTLYAVAGGHVTYAGSMSEGDHPAVYVNSDGSVNADEVAEAVRYWNLYRTAHAAIHGADTEAF